MKKISIAEEESEEQERFLIKTRSRHQEEQATEEDDSEYIAPAFDEVVPIINFVADKLIEANKWVLVYMHNQIA